MGLKGNPLTKVLVTFLATVRFHPSMDELVSLNAGERAEGLVTDAAFVTPFARVGERVDF